MFYGNEIYLFYVIRCAPREKYEKTIIYSVFLVLNQSNSTSRGKSGFPPGRKPWLALNSSTCIGSIDHSFLNEFDVALSRIFFFCDFVFFSIVQFNVKHIAIR